MPIYNQNPKKNIVLFKNMEKQIITLRDYQNDTIKEIRKRLRLGLKHLIVQLPTGGGKTIVFTYMSTHAALKSNKTLIFTDRTELLKQATKSMAKFNIRAGNIKAGSKVIDYDKDVYVAMSQTFKKRIDKKEFQDFIKDDISIIIIDEAHKQEFNYLFESGLLKDKIVLGFTATPSRGGKMRQLGLDYEYIVEGPQVRELVNKGYLVNSDTYVIPAPSMSGVGIDSKTGDYKASEMFSRFNTQKVYSGLVKQYKQHSPGKKMIVFCVNIEHCIKTTIELNNSGIKAKFVASNKSVPKKPETDEPGKISKYNEDLRIYEYWLENYNLYSGERSKVFDEFENSEIDALVNVDIATTGYDCPSIEVVAVMRATKSLTLWLQMIGRGSRIFPGKENFIIFDFGNNSDPENLGDYDTNRGWSLWHEESKSGGGVPPLKLCGIDSNEKPIPSGNNVLKGCQRLIMAMQNICPFCGFKYPEKKAAAEVELVLSEIIDEQGVSLAVKHFKDMDFEELKIYRTAKKHKQPWLWRQLWTRGERMELERFANYDKWSRQTLQKAIVYCESVFVK